ncbi:hypothetical protein HZC07_00365 [Candidatus Micrarchaeota archaeon]|nr:hypothetical protein [Candidatus Micrarchaeota archaeon]
MGVSLPRIITASLSGSLHFTMSLKLSATVCAFCAATPSPTVLPGFGISPQISLTPKTPKYTPTNFSIYPILSLFSLRRRAYIG